MKFWFWKSTKNDQWYWHLKAANNQIIATSGEGYHNRADCLHAIQLIQKGAETATVHEA